MNAAAMDPLEIRFVVGITGHRGSHRAVSAGGDRIADALGAVFATIDAMLVDEARVAAPIAIGRVRLITLLAHGVDQLAATHAVARGWDIAAPLPFGPTLNIAVNALPRTAEDAAALLAGAAATDPAVQARAEGIRRWSGAARVFALADRDAEVAALLTATLDAPDDTELSRRFGAVTSAQAALAGRVMIEHVDLLIGVWDGEVRDLVGGTGHTIICALETGTPVLLIDPANPALWSIVVSTEGLARRRRAETDDILRLRAVINGAVMPRAGKLVTGLAEGRWRRRSSRVATLYRRIEAVFGGEGRPFRSLTERYEEPAAIAAGSAADMLAAARAIPGADHGFIETMAASILPAFAWTDGISAWLSDAYRSGMIANFILSALAIIVGVAYLPLDLTDAKWMFAVVEFLLLASILVITWIGGRRRLHARWFETRRLAEYLRHAPILLLSGVARPSSRWPRGAGTNWPEHAAQHRLRALGLPAVTVTTPFLRATLQTLLAPHVARQRAYHHAKAKRLATVHHRLDHLAETLFKLAVGSVAIYLLLKAGSVLHVIPHAWPAALSKTFSFLGVALPTLGASIAGIRFFGDFERFAAISEVTAGKLEQVERRIDDVLAGPDPALDYAGLAKIAHTVDDIVVGEIESWQAVFSGKHIALPA